MRIKDFRRHIAEICRSSEPEPEALPRGMVDGCDALPPTLALPRARELLVKFLEVVDDAGGCNFDDQNLAQIDKAPDWPELAALYVEITGYIMGGVSFTGGEHLCIAGRAIGDQWRVS